MEKGEKSKKIVVVYLFHSHSKLFIGSYSEERKQISVTVSEKGRERNTGDKMS